MSDALFPSNLPGVTWNIARTPSFSTGVYEALSGAERRIRHRENPKERIELGYELLREDSSFAELQAVLGFYLERDGPFDSFLFHDPYHGLVTNLQFGIGNGVTRQFQLVRRVGNKAQTVHNPAATAGVGYVWFPVAGDDADFWPESVDAWPGDVYSPADGLWTLLANGVVEFAIPPAWGKRLLWTGLYYYRARFADDTIDYNEFMRRLFETKKVPLVMSLLNIL